MVGFIRNSFFEHHLNYYYFFCVSTKKLFLSFCRYSVHNHQMDWKGIRPRATKTAQLPGLPNETHEGDGEIPQGSYDHSKDV